MASLLHVALRQNAVFIPAAARVYPAQAALTEATALLAANLAKLGFGLDQPLLLALNQTSQDYQNQLLQTFQTVLGVNKNWTPLVKGWDVPTGEGYIDHLLTFYANIFNKLSGTRLACGHLIPDNTFPLHRYNGCPFCGAAFETNTLPLLPQGSKQKLLRLWQEADAAQFFASLLTAKTALDATQLDSLNILLAELPLPNVQIEMKETAIATANACIALGLAEKAASLFKTPADILRLLWYRHTGYLQIIEPKTLVLRAKKNHKHISAQLNQSKAAHSAAKNKLKLKYTRTFSKAVAGWLEALPMPAEKAAEIMHPKRNIWVRFIRALRLTEYAKNPNFPALARLLDVFYREDYPVWQAQVDRQRRQRNAQATFELLQTRPGLFARALFANMLWFGAEATAQAFAKIIDKVPARLLFTLNSFAPIYFTPLVGRVAKPIGGGNKVLPAHPLLKKYSKAERLNMQKSVEDLCYLAMQKRFAAQNTPNKTIYIDPSLDKMPVAIGDRSDSVQDLPVALMGQRFDLQGDTLRIFMQWGEGLPAQHIDMDLSCRIVYPDRADICYFSHLVALGCKHSGDIRQIPDKVGTAEYIDIDLPQLEAANAKYVVFTSNAYSNGSLSPNLVLGWMNSKNPMSISPETGVAYDPSCVQHQIRITQKLTKGLIFGVLEVPTRQIIWLEMAFAGQLATGFDLNSVEALLQKLNHKLNIGGLLRLKAAAQNLQIVDSPDQADEAYTLAWATNAAAVTQLLID